jgi:hypothetical protein
MHFAWAGLNSNPISACRYDDSMPSYFVEMASNCDPISTSEVARITGVNHHTWPHLVHFNYIYIHIYNTKRYVKDKPVA